MKNGLMEKGTTEIRAYLPSPGDRFWISTDSIDDTLAKLINKNNIRILKTEKTTIKKKWFLFFKKKKTYKMMLIEIISPLVEED